MDPSTAKTDKITQFLDKISEETPQILPMPKIGNQRNPFTKKSPMCRIHNKLATKTCLLVHYGEYFCDLCDHECGEVEDIRQSDKIRKNAFKEVKQNHKDLISKVEALNTRRQESEDVDLIFYHVLDAVKLVHQKIKNEQEGKSQESYQLAGFLNRFER